MPEARMHRVRVRVSGYVWAPVDPEMMESERRGDSGLDLAADMTEEVFRDFPELRFRVERDSLEVRE